MAWTISIFSESHSHATEQKLVKTDLDKIIGKTDRIIFIEDEVTTGNTILNIVRLIQKDLRKAGFVCGGIHFKWNE